MSPPVNPADRSSQGLMRDVWLMLALLAVGLRILVPVGFMPGSTEQGTYGLVLCTAEGAVSIDPAKDKAPAKSGHDGACVFAAHAAAGPEPTVEAAVEPAYAQPAALAQPAQTSLAPGRGLAAPPLPARGPPLFVS